MYLTPLTNDSRIARLQTMMLKIIRYFVTPSKSNKSQWIVTSVALDDAGNEFNTGRVHGVGSKKWMKELKSQLQHELASKVKP